jgi:prophage regulatory protein
LSKINLVPPHGLKARGITYSRFQLWRLEQEGRFPKRVRISPARVAWVETEIDEWLAAKVAERDREAA